VASVEKIWEAISRLAVAAALLISSGLLAWQWNQEDRINANSGEIRVIQSNRFTNADAAKDAANLERRLRDELPPEWLEKIVDELKAGQLEMRDRLARIETVLEGR
jgi:hypothetical protein